jgi:hypothetical protein
LVSSTDQIRERRQHFTSDGIPELRIAAIPVEVVGLDLEAEKDSPECLASLLEQQENEEDGEKEGKDEDFTSSQQSRKPRKTVPWNPHDEEKLWIAEAIVRRGVPQLVEDWHQKQRDILADPLKFATRKCKPAPANKRAAGNPAPIDRYFAVAKPVVTQRKQTGSLLGPKLTTQKETSSALKDGLHKESADITSFFRCTKPDTRKKPSTQVNDQGEKTGATSSASGALDSFSLPNNQKSILQAGARVAAGDTEKISALQMSPARRRNLKGLPDTVSSSVTQRKKPSRPVKTKTQEEGSRTIESFFEAAHAQREQLQRLEEEIMNPQMVQPAPAKGAKKLYVMVRDSLPGTWTLVDEDEGVISAKSARAPRVSIADLTAL